MFRCTGFDNLFWYAACQLGVKVENVIRSIAGKPLLESPEIEIEALPVKASTPTRERIEEPA